MPNPTDEQLREYAEKLPAIYKRVLMAFPDREPNRRFGDALIEEAIEDYVLKIGEGHRIEDVFAALEKLAAQKFLKKQTLSVFQPTPLGERLITVLTGKTPAIAEIPELPVPTWG